MDVTPHMIRQHLPHAWSLYQRLSTKVALIDPAIEDLPPYMDGPERDQIILAFACDETRKLLDKEFGFTAKLLNVFRAVAFKIDMEYEIPSDHTVEELKLRYPGGFELALRLPDLALHHRRLRLSGLPREREIREAYSLLAVDPYRRKLDAERKAA